MTFLGAESNIQKATDCIKNLEGNNPDEINEIPIKSNDQVILRKTKLSTAEEIIRSDEVVEVAHTTQDVTNETNLLAKPEQFHEDTFNEKIKLITANPNDGQTNKHQANENKNTANITNDAAPVTANYVDPVIVAYEPVYLNITSDNKDVLDNKSEYDLQYEHNPKNDENEGNPIVIEFQQTCHQETVSDNTIGDKKTNHIEVKIGSNETISLEQTSAHSVDQFGNSSNETKPRYFIDKPFVPKSVMSAEQPIHVALDKYKEVSGISETTWIDNSTKLKIELSLPEIGNEKHAMCSKPDREVNILRHEEQFDSDNKSLIDLSNSKSFEEKLISKEDSLNSFLKGLKLTGHFKNTLRKQKKSKIRTDTDCSSFNSVDPIIKLQNVISKNSTNYTTQNGKKVYSQEQLCRINFCETNNRKRKIKRSPPIQLLKKSKHLRTLPLSTSTPKVSKLPPKYSPNAQNICDLLTLGKDKTSSNNGVNSSFKTQPKLNVKKKLLKNPNSGPKSESSKSHTKKKNVDGIDMESDPKKESSLSFPDFNLPRGHCQSSNSKYLTDAGHSQQNKNIKNVTKCKVKTLLPKISQDTKDLSTLAVIRLPSSTPNQEPTELIVPLTNTPDQKAPNTNLVQNTSSRSGVIVSSHKRNFKHKTFPKVTKDKRNKCEYCFESFSSVRQLNAHDRKFHSAKNLFF